MTEQTNGTPAAENEDAALINGLQERAHAEGRAEGHAAGRQEANARFAAILADDKVKGRERTAMDLALKSPDMKAEDVVAFVASLPAAQSIPTIAERQNGADLLLGGPSPRKDAKAMWDKATANVNKRRGFAA